MPTQTLHISDKTFELYRSAEQLHAIVSRLAQELNRDYANQKVVFVIVLKGAYLFAADLLRKLNIDNTVAFVKVSSYNGTESSGAVKEQLPVTDDIFNQHVVVIEDIVETGLTMEFLLNSLKQRHPKTLRLCTLLHKPHRFKGNFTIDYIGENITDEFVIGYGFDYEEKGRNLPNLYQQRQ